MQRIFGLTDPPWRLQGAGAILLVHAYSMYVYFYLFVRAALQSLDASLYEAAASLGAGRWRTLRRVVLPQLYPALGGAALLTFMTALASFSAPYIFGGGFRVMPTQIVATRLNGDDRLAMVETISLSAAWRWPRSGSFAARGPVGGSAGGRKGAAPRGCAVRSRPLRLALPCWAGGSRPAAPAAAPDAAAGLVRADRHLDDGAGAARLHAPQLPHPGAGPGPGSAAGQQPLAGDGRHRRRGRDRAGRRARERPAPGREADGWIEALLALPWAVPGTVFAIALATAFSVRSPWAGRIVLVGTLWILPLAYLVRNLPITSRAILAGVRALDPSLDEAAATLGAGRGRTLRRITLPLLRPALLAGASLAFVTAFGDFVTSIMLYTYDTRPISLEILSSLRQSDVGVAAAYGVVLMLVSAARLRGRAPTAAATDDARRRTATGPGSAGWRC